MKKLLLLALLLCCVIVACQEPPKPAEKKEISRQPGILTKKRLASPEHRAYLGAYIDFGETEDAVTLEAILNFDQLVGRQQAIVAMSSYWGRQIFPVSELKIITAYGAVPLIYWSPWDAPFEERRGPDRFSLVNILAGQWDAYIDMWAREAKAFHEPLLVAFGIEMNGNWFPWSGWFYGNGKVFPNTDPPLYEGPELYKKAYRYVVDRVRAQGVKNIDWVFHVNNASMPNEPWNRMANYYPGDNYVDWLGLSAYGKLFPGPWWIRFEDLTPSFAEVCDLHPTKPFILAEWGIGEFPKNGNKAEWLNSAFKRLGTEFPRLKAAVFWHERWQNDDLSYSNLRVNSSTEALEAYRNGIAAPFWLSRPSYR